MTTDHAWDGPCQRVTVEVVAFRPSPTTSTGLAFRVVRRSLPDGGRPDAAALDLAGGEGAVEVVHSTSWRFDAAQGVVLTYAALPDGRHDLRAVGLEAPGIVSSADPLRPQPGELHTHHVAAHALVHLAELAERDPAISQVAGRDDTGLWRLVARVRDHAPTGPHDQVHRLAAEADLSHAAAVRVPAPPRQDDDRRRRATVLAGADPVLP